MEVDHIYSVCLSFRSPISNCSLHVYTFLSTQIICTNSSPKQFHNTTYFYPFINILLLQYKSMSHLVFDCSFLQRMKLWHRKRKEITIKA